MYAWSKVPMRCTRLVYFYKSQYVHTHILMPILYISTIYTWGPSSVVLSLIGLLMRQEILGPGLDSFSINH